MTRIVALVCIASVIFAPLQMMAAEGAATAPVSAEMPTFRPFANTEVITTSPLAPVAGYGVFMAGAQPGDFSGYVATADKSTNVRSLKGTIFTEDGYSLRTRLLRNDADVVRVHLIARGPDGRTAEAMLTGLKRNGAVEKTGLREVQDLLGRSAHFSLLGSVVPNFVHAPATSRGKLRVGTNDACTGNEIAMFGATLAVIATCGAIEVTGDVLGCIAAIVALVGLMVTVYDSCGAPDLCGDGPCPVVDEPPCTSYSIC